MHKVFFAIASIGLLCAGFGCRQGKDAQQEIGGDAEVVGEEIKQLLSDHR